MSTPSDREKRLCEMFDSYCKSVLDNTSKYLLRKMATRAQCEGIQDPDVMIDLLPQTDEYPSDGFIVFADELTCEVHSETVYKALMSMPEKQRKVCRVLVVAPLSILGVWNEEFVKFADFDYVLAVLSGTGSKKADTLRHMRGTSLQVAVVNYESAWRLEKEILAWQPDLVIADEGHKIKTHNIAASKAMHRIGVKAAYRLLLTGTVITNKAIDVFNQYKYLNPAIFGQSIRTTHRYPFVKRCTQNPKSVTLYQN